jgi:hypothetical protein
MCSEKSCKSGHLKSADIYEGAIAHLGDLVPEINSSIIQILELIIRVNEKKKPQTLVLQ